MDVVSECPLRIASVLWQPSSGGFVLTVACKVTYVLCPGVSPLADEQDDLNEADSYWDDDDRRSLSAASDLAPMKPRADVFLLGHAYASERRPVTMLVARLVVGTLTKTIEVYGDRAFARDGQLHGPQRYTRMPLRWERAAGGPNTLNPVGLSMEAPLNAHHVRPIPNLQPSGMYIAKPSDEIPPVGFGPVAPTWPGRTAKLHRHAARWDYQDWHRAPLPEDLDPAFFNAAPPDQQVELLRPNERIALENLHLEHPRLVTNLGGVIPRATVRRRGVLDEDLRIWCDTLCIDTDRGTCSLTWRGWLKLREPEEQGVLVITADGEALQANRFDPSVTRPLSFESAFAAAPVLPFVRSASGPIAPSVEEAFVRQPVAPASPDDGTGTLIVPFAPAEETLPFARPADDDAYVQTAAALLAPTQTAPSNEVTEKLRSREVVAAPVLAPLSIGDPRVARGLPSPPPMVGPLAHVAGSARADAPAAFKEAPPETAPPVGSRGRVDTAAEPVPAESSPDPVAIPIERYAAILAEIAETHVARRQILETQGLTERSWERVTHHWSGAIEREAQRGSGRLRAESDAAYVATVERLRGRKITLEEYAQLVVAMERATAGEVLDELRIQRPALMPIMRLWTKRVSMDMRLAGEATSVLAKLRSA